MRNALIMAVVGCLALTPASVAEDYGTLGATFEITEQDLVEWIAERLRQADEAGMLDQLNEDFRERVERSGGSSWSGCRSSRSAWRCRWCGLASWT